MARQHAVRHVSPGYLPEIRQVQMHQPWSWLKAGWHDLRRHPGIGIGYGLIIAAAYGLLVGVAGAAGLYDVALQLTAGFVLLAPVFALGFYTVSRRLEAGEPVAFQDVFRAWRVNAKGVLGLGGILVLLFLSWFMVSIQATAVLAESQTQVILTFGGETWAEFVSGLTARLSFLIAATYLLIGLVAVLLGFAFAAFSIPLLLDDPETDAVTALVASWKAVLANWRPMLLWAVLIAVLTGVGLALAYVGLAVTMPLLGFATWHAYRETLGEWKEVEVPHVGYY